MNGKNQDGRPLVEMLWAEKNGCERLIDLLEQEWTCLKRRDVTGLIGLTRKKESRVLEVKEIREKIRAWLKAAAGEGNSPAGSVKAAPQALELQRDLDRLKREIFSLNDRNKRYIEETLRLVEHFFSLLALPEEKPPVYMRYENGRAAPGARSLISRRL
jgi:DNA repair exonuclease SbcCD ATPase subunit